jgi:hypothetical protein
LPALPIGQFGYDGANGDDALLFNRQLYTEQLYEYTTMPTYSNASNTSLPLNNNNIYNGLGTTRANFDGANYTGAPTPLDWHKTYYEAINYCAYKNRPSTKGASGAITTADVKWYLPSQAQLMAMWISYESYKGASASNFKTDSYWSATNNILYPGESQYLNFNYGNVGHYNRSTKYVTRCVRNEAAPPLIFTPMVSGSAIAHEAIIDFSVTGAMPASAYTIASKGTGIGNELSGANKTLFRKIGIAAAEGTQMTWLQAQTYCANYSGGGWRLPTQRELQAIWILKVELENAGLTPFANDYYWTATESSSYNTNAWMVWMSSSPAGDAGNTPHIIKTHKASVRCVRETP